MDNESEPAYPDLTDPNITTIHTLRLSYSKSLNLGARGEWDWILSLSNDVLCCGPFIDQLKALPPWVGIAGKDVNRIIHYTYVGGWLMAIPRHAWDMLGPFDEDFVISAWEDLDYTWRVMEAGLKAQLMSDFPFHHLDQRQRQSMGANNAHYYNGALFERKHNIPAPLRRYLPGGLIESRWTGD